MNFVYHLTKWYEIIGGIHGPNQPKPHKESAAGVFLPANKYIILSVIWFLAFNQNRSVKIYLYNFGYSFST